jgi:hypothetical protein
MSDERKPLWPRFVVLLIGLPVLYVLGYGVTKWLVDHHVIPKHMAQHLVIFYPIAWLYRNGPEWLHDAIGWYCHLWE